MKSGFAPKCVGGYIAAAACLLFTVWTLNGFNATPRQSHASPNLALKPQLPPSPAPAAMPTRSDDKTKLSTLQANLQVIRTQVGLYRFQHDGQYPAAETFAACLTGRTNTKGQPMPVGGSVADYPWPPYLHPSYMSNPFIDDRTAALQVKTGTGPCPGDGTTGWYFNTHSHRLSPNDPQHKDL